MQRLGRVEGCMTWRTRCRGTSGYASKVRRRPYVSTDNRDRNVIRAAYAPPIPNGELETMTDRQRTVVITGAARRLGRALALDFARAGWRVGVHYATSENDAQAVVDEIIAAGGVAAGIGADLADSAAVLQIMPTLAEQLGPVTCLVNNASKFVYDDIASLTPAMWDAHQAVNLRAPVLLAQALAAQLPADTPGNVINIIDQRVWKPTPHFFSYSASKAGLWAVTQTLAQGLAPRIRVNAIGPGPMLQSVHQKAEDFTDQAAATLLQRGTSPEEICAAVRYIMAAPALTGQMLALDGGQHLAWQTPDIGDGRG
jgi:NAD(P)-dependent dehydrogenase (short-subunit alcohol dehydrogenase family)